MATISDVAKRAGVSPSAVSGVLNNSIKVKPETRRRIEQAVEELNYRPHAMARGLRTKTPPAWGLVIPSIDNPYYPAVARGVEDVARSLGLALYVCNTDHKKDQEEAYLERLVSQASGVIVTDTRADARKIKALLDNGVCVVLVNPRFDIKGARVITIDYRTGSIEAVEHLASLGHERIGYICGPSGVWRFEERLEGYRLGLAAAGLTYDDALVVEADLTAGGGYRACRELLTRRPQPTALMFANDIMAVGGLSAISDAGLRVPDDVSVVGFDNIALLDYVRPFLTTVYQPSYELGRVAGESLAEKSPGPARRLATRLVVRDSCGRVAG